MSRAVHGWMGALAACLFLPAIGCGSPQDTETAEKNSASGYDYIVVGAGAAGAPLAARLGAAGKRVLVLEAGEDAGGSLRYQVPAMHALSTEDPSMAWWYFVEHHAEEGLDQQDSKFVEEGILYPRGSGLGGSTAVNAMVTVLPSPSDWNAIATLTGDPSWRALSMVQHHDAVREWLSVELPDPSLAAGDDVVQGFLAGAAAVHAQENLGTIINPADLLGTAGALSSLIGGDVNETLLHAEATGLFRLPLATKSGRRFGARERLLEAAKQHDIEIVTGALVTRVLWNTDVSPPRAIGVEYVEQPNVYGANIVPDAPTASPKQVFTEGEVILSAGAFNSPQLLMLSGVGNPGDLEPLGIAPVAGLPGVGRNLQDRYEAPVVTQVNHPLNVLSGCRLGEVEVDDPCLAQWEQGEGVYTTPGFLATLLTRSPEAALADLQIFASPTDARGYYPGYAIDAANARDRFTWLILKAHTNNHDGWVRLRDASPFSRPNIRFNSYDETAPLQDPDLMAMVHAVHLIRDIAAQADRVVDETTTLTEVWPGDAAQTDEELAQWIRKESWGHHACCTNPIGADDDLDAVLDTNFRVRHTDGLRVVDASVFPTIPGTFIALPTYMIAEKAAQTLLEDAP